MSLTVRFVNDHQGIEVRHCLRHTSCSIFRLDASLFDILRASRLERNLIVKNSALVGKNGEEK